MDVKKDIGRKLCSFYPQKVLTFCSVTVEKSNNEMMSKMTQNARFHFFKSTFDDSSLD